VEVAGYSMGSGRITLDSRCIYSGFKNTQTYNRSWEAHRWENKVENELEQF